MISDPIGDMLTRIRNAQAVGKADVELPYSKIKENIALVLKQERFIKDFKKFKKEGKKLHMLSLVLSYEDDKPKISVVRRVSKPGERVYLGNKDIKSVLGGFGISLISTSRGVMSGRDAKKKSLGGEVICEIW